MQARPIEAIAELNKMGLWIPKVIKAFEYYGFIPNPLAHQGAA